MLRDSACVRTCPHERRDPAYRWGYVVLGGGGGGGRRPKCGFLNGFFRRECYRRQAGWLGWVARSEKPKRLLKRGYFYRRGRLEFVQMWLPGQVPRSVWGEVEKAQMCGAPLPNISGRVLYMTNIAAHTK